jgi:hypothetical protein
LAEKVYDCALQGESWAANMIADRLEGKPAQETTINVNKHDRTDWTREELVAIVDDARARSKGTAAANGRDGKPDQVHCGGLSVLTSML